MQSQILHWLFNPTEVPSAFKESAILRGLRKISSKRSFAWISPLAKALLCALLFASIFIPRFSVGSIFSFYSLDVRLEDLLLVALGLLVGVRMLSGKAFSEIPLAEKAFLGFLLAAEISILSGFFLRTIDKPFLSLLYLVKWFEYFLVLVVTVRFTEKEEDRKLFLWAFFWTGMAAALFGYWEHFFPFAKAVYPNYYRLYERPPFHGDANHLGGFFVLWIGVFTGVFLKTSHRTKAGLLLIALLFIFFPLIWTYSRKSYFALAGAFLISFPFVKEKKRFLLLFSLFVMLSLALPTRLAERLHDLEDALVSDDPFHSSWAGNLAMWQQSLWNFEKYFLFGSGFGSRHRLYYESQYVLILSETGIFGFALFVGLCLSLFRQWILTRQKSAEGWTQGIRIGWLMGFGGLLIHNASCVSWTVSKIAIPFWFVTAAVLTPWAKGSSRR